MRELRDGWGDGGEEPCVGWVVDVVVCGVAVEVVVVLMRKSSGRRGRLCRSVCLVFLCWWASPGGEPTGASLRVSLPLLGASLSLPFVFSAASFDSLRAVSGCAGGTPRGLYQCAQIRCVRTSLRSSAEGERRSCPASTAGRDGICVAEAADHGGTSKGLFQVRLLRWPLEGGRRAPEARIVSPTMPGVVGRASETGRGRYLERPIPPSSLERSVVGVCSVAAWGAWEVAPALWAS